MIDECIESRSIVSDYLDITSELRCKYGLNTILFMQIGSWYEVYDITNESIQIKACTQILGLNASLKRNTNDILCGIPADKPELFEKHVKKLIQHGFTVVRMIQTDYNKNKLRKIDKVISPGCSFVDDDSTSSMLMNVLFIEEFDNAQVYFSFFDINLGILEYMSMIAPNIAEVIKMFKDILYEIGECNEINIYYKSYSTHWNDFKKMCNFNIISQHFNNLNENQRHFVFDKRFQTAFFEEIFPKYKHIGGTVFNHMHMDENNINELASIIFLIMFLRDHDELLIQNIMVPKLYKKNENGNVKCLNSIFEKLDIFTNHKGLFHLLSNQKTKLGERFLRRILHTPIYDTEILQKRYNLMIQFTKFTEYDKLEYLLSKICDIEKLQRKFSLHKILPSDINKCFTSYSSVLKIYSNVQQIYFDDQLSSVTVKYISKICEKIEKIFDLDKCSKNQFAIHFGICEELDYLVQKEKELQSFLEKKLQYFNKILGTQDGVKLVQSSNGEYSVQTTIKRGQALEQKVLQDCKIIYTNKLSYLHGSFDEQLSEYSNIHNDINRKIKEVVHEQCNILSIDIDIIYKSVATFVAYIDVFASMSKFSMKHNYVCPQLNGDFGMIRCDKLRHPIIERIVVEEGNNYIPNDVLLSPLSSWLLYGVNSVGKSSLLKSIMINTILAQCGFFVAADSFIFQPFKSFGCRIGNQDDIFLGQSSYIKELIEMNTILCQVNTPSLVITDEMCSSTETSSAVKVMCSFIQQMSERRITFACATHHFEIQKNGYIQGLLTLKNKHMKVDIENDEIVFDRIIYDGIPENKEYGVQIAKTIIHDERFKQLLNSKFHDREKYDDSQISISSYNKNSLKIACENCGYRPKCSTDKRLHTHHIKFQCSADNFGNTEHGQNIHNLSNLITLCEKCHIAVHKNEISITVSDTASGSVVKIVK